MLQTSTPVDCDLEKPPNIYQIFVCQRYEYRIDHLCLSHNASQSGGQYPGLSTQLRSTLQLIQFMRSTYWHRLICIMGYVQMGYHVLCQSIPNYSSLHCSLQLLRSVHISIALCCHTALNCKVFAA